MAREEKYNLQRLLEMRERAREEAGFYLAECRRLLNAAEEELEKRKQAVEDCRESQRKTQQQMIEKSGGGIKSSEIVRFRQHLVDLRERETEILTAVEEQKRAVERAEQTVEKALGALNEAAKETKVIEKHRENWTSANRVDAARREQKTNDEIGAILHERQKFDR
jgi:flagellar export protein FliJ